MAFDINRRINLKVPSYLFIAKKHVRFHHRYNIRMKAPHFSCTKYGKYLISAVLVALISCAAWVGNLLKLDGANVTTPVASFYRCSDSNCDLREHFSTKDTSKACALVWPIGHRGGVVETVGLANRASALAFNSCAKGSRVLGSVSGKVARYTCRMRYLENCHRF